MWTSPSQLRKVLAIGAVAALTATAACGGGDTAGGGPAPVPEKVTIGIGGAGVIAYAATYVAQQEGFLDEELKAIGSSPAYIDLEGSVAAVQALATEQADFITSVSSAGLAAVAEGGEIVQVSQFLTTDMVFLTATPGLPDTDADPKQIVEGRKWGIPGFGSTAHLTALAALVKWGYSPSDVEFVPIGHVASSAAAVEQQLADYYWLGTVAEGLIADGTVNMVLDFFDPATTEKYYGGTYATAGLFALPEYVQANPTVATAVVKAHTRAMEAIQANIDDPAAVMAMLPEELRKDATLALLKRVLPGYSPSGEVDATALERVVTVSKAGELIDPGAEIDVAAFADNKHR
ncbi:ABC transporter substrate-binding protein [Actinokineospora guangxiensis]|uniref:ABC transporter substrate-binding protein n=1 Tax=Actinokineospora guangxiensis TaxID=1490288 RepID=A0ABW0EW87_9PSEU